MSSFRAVLGVEAWSPHCYLLRVAGLTLLLDCGWNTQFEPADIAALESVCPDVDAVLLSHSSLPHLGALAYCEAQFGLRCPVYATLPVQRMGELAMYDAHQQRIGQDALHCPFTLDDIDRTFARIITIKYSEETQLQREARVDADMAGDTGGDGDAAMSDSVSRVTVTPHPSGHSLGGTLWSITVDTDVLLYAVSYHHSKEKHVDGGVIEAFQRPSLLIADACTLGVETPQRRVREQQLCQLVHETCATHRSIALLPSDSASRVLELLLVLYTHFDSAQLFGTVPLIVLSHTCETLLEYARSQLEWMSETVQKFFNADQQRNNPFEMVHITLAQSLRHCQAITHNFTRPACILASDAELDTSLALQVFEAIHQQPNARVILTQPTPPQSLAAQLRQRASSSNAASFPVTYTKHVPTPLGPSELHAYQQKREMEREQKAVATVHDTSAVRAAMGDESKEAGPGDVNAMDDDDDTQFAAPVAHTATASAAASTSVTTLSHAFYVFPHTEHKRDADRYGLSFTLPLPLPPTPASTTAVATAGRHHADSGNPRALSQLDKSSKLVNTQESSAPFAAAATGAGGGESRPRSTEATEPSRMVPTPVRVSVACSVSFVDMAGLSDERAWRNVITRVKPRKLILVHGQQQPKEQFRQHVIERNLLTHAQTPAQSQAQSDGVLQSSVLAPSSGSVIPLASEQLFRASLHPALLATLRFATVNDFAVAHLRAAIHSDAQAGGRANRTQLVPVTNASTARSLRPSSYYLGEYKFGELRRLLSAAGIDSEFYVKGGVIVAANGTVRIRRTATNQLTLSGLISDSYYAVRTILYNNFAVI